MVARTTYIFLFLCIIGACTEESAVIPAEAFPTTIAGTVKTESGIPVANAKVSLPTSPDFPAVFTAGNGTFLLTGVPQAEQALRVEKLGFESYESRIPRSVNTTATVNPVLRPRTYVIPSVKPVSTGPVRIFNKALQTDFDRDGSYEPFVVRGAAFSPAPIGGKPWTKAVYDRSIIWLGGLNANTVRTYSGVDKYFLQKAAENGIRVIVSYWVDLDMDLSLPAVRQQVVDGFATMVLDLKDAPGVLMWNLGNEQNYSSTQNNGNSPYWYSLAEEMAVAAYKVEGASFHPVCISNGNLYNIGASTMLAADSSLAYVDCWGSNAYEQNFTNFFATYRTRSSKPIVITEFGIDALNNVTKTEHEAVQAYFDSTNWLQIRTASDVCVGATVFEFTDEWWKAGDPDSHDYGGYATNAHPDGYSNEEWWGLIAVTPDADNDGLDEWRPRKVYEMFKRNWK
jgi:hypothetical protein